jgi:AcrR family transcriptional regulator
VPSARQSLRPQRADARRNRDALVAAARSAFATRGPDVPMAEIAQAAGVGNGTLYRHFPERELLIAAVFRDDLATVCDQTRALLARYPADQALELWLNELVRYVRQNLSLKRVLMAGPQLAGWSPDTPLPPVYAEIGSLLLAAVSQLLTPALAQGLIGPPANPRDLLRLTSAICQIEADPAEATRMVALIVDGLRHRR